MRISVAPERRALRQIYHLFDLSSLSISSVGPIFSVAAAGGAMAQAAGAAVPLAILLIAVPFMLCSWIFLSLNQHFPNAGASYHWSRRVIGIDFSNFQAWVVVMAYFWSIPPILIPAARFTLETLGDPAPGAGALVLVAMGWALFAALVLLFGARMTARVTQIFLVIEVVSVGFVAVLGYGAWGHAAPGAAGFSLHHVRWSGVIVCMVLAATIVDGWEIDSYASEEARRPRLTPGWGGVIGVVSVVVYYLLIWPLLLHQVPLAALAHSPDTLSLWARTVAPGFLPWMRLAIIASTAGGLWLTTYILSRALYAMARDGVMPRLFGVLNRLHVPVWAIIGPIGAAVAVVMVQMVFPAVQGLFALVLSAAGFFLVAEFWLDGVTMLMFLLRRHGEVRHRVRGHHHLGLLLAAVLVVVSLALVDGLFVIEGPVYIQAGVDRTILLLLGLGVVFTLGLRARKSGRLMFVFHGAAVEAPKRIAPE